MTDHAADTIAETLDAARTRLLAARNERGYWEGELSSSALSTATAVCALRMRDVARAETSNRALIEAGIGWLVASQNEDGGWGDTAESVSNISTSALVWCALAGAEPGCDAAERRLRSYLTGKAGGLAPTTLAEAIRRRYGQDQTFSVPILTTLALHGRLGEQRLGWGLVPQLPFELAAIPAKWYAAARMPVVSYALPALIAIGLVRHAKRPGVNPATRLTRAAARARVLRTLESIQPDGGGFLEATPLTSFVAMGLIGAGLAEHPVVQQAVEFLVASVRPDGSWPIDTNLATWVTTLSVNAVCPSSGAIDRDAAEQLRGYLVGSQYRQKHPYTQAAPGGWAWTELPGGVPDADDTPGAMLALRGLTDDTDHQANESLAAAADWLVNLQNRDGGMPTFCRGWGTLPFDRSSCDITAHGYRALAACEPRLGAKGAERARRARGRMLAYLAQQQRPDGAWRPLWFGNQHAAHEDETNLTYGVSRVLVGLAEDPPSDSPGRPSMPRAVEYLLRSQNADGGWGGVAGVASSIEETAQAVEALAACFAVDAGRVEGSLRRGVGWLAERTNGGRSFPPSPIGFYFAKLWYHEQLYPLVFTVAALTRAQRVLTA